MRKLQKGFAIPIIIAIVALLVIGGGASVWYSPFKKVGVPRTETIDGKNYQFQDYAPTWGQKGVKASSTKPSIALISPNGGEVLDGKSINKITWISSGLKDTDTVSIGFRPMSDISRVCWLEGIDEPPITANQGSFDIIPGNIYCTRESSKWDSLSRYKIQLQVNQYTEGLGVADMSDDYFIIK